MLAELATFEPYSFRTLVLHSKNVYESIGKKPWDPIEGYFLTSGFSSIMHIAEYANANNKVLAMNLSAPFLCEFFSEQLLQVLPYVDFLFGNEHEGAAFATKMKYADKSVTAIAAGIAAHDKKNAKRTRTAIITQGSKATVVSNGGTTVAFEVPKLDPSLIVDANGAGDAFCGGFLARLVEGKPIADCVAAGHYAARCILQVSGTALPKTAPAL